MIIVYFLLAVSLSIIFALLEIQIEGKNGWASALPTWKFYRSWFKYIPGGNKPITGYHTFLWIFIFLYAHVSFLFASWSIGKEALIVSFVMLVLRLEDFLWFVFNPNYGLKKFKKGFIPWHKNWLGPLPIQYYTSITVWILLFIFAIFKL